MRVLRCGDILSHMARGTIFLRRHIGSELRRLRELSGYSLADAAKRVGRTDTALSRAETGRSLLPPDIMSALARLYGAGDAKIAQLLSDSAMAATGQPWWTPYVLGVPTGFEMFLGAEAQAVTIQTLSHLVPGLLQTEAYARAVLKPGVSPDQLDLRVAVRLGRQAILTKLDSPRLHVILDEVALRRRVGSDDVMAEQMAHLTQIATAGPVTLQIMLETAGFYPGMESTYVVFGFGGKYPPFVYVESIAGSLYQEDPKQVDFATRSFTEASAQALSPSDTVQYLSGIIPGRQRSL